jgi:hypothetical protein
MTIITLKIILALFIYLALSEIICKKWKFKKGTKKFVNITCKIVSVAIFVFASVDLVQFLINGKF